MADSQRSDEGPNTDSGKNDARRDFLKLLTAGALGGSVVAGVGHVFESGDRPANNNTDPPEDGSTDRPESRNTGDQVPESTTFDVSVHERDSDYEVHNANGETIANGSEGWDVLERGIAAVPENGSIYVEGRFHGASSIKVDKSIRLVGPEAVIEHEGSGDFVFSFEGMERYQTELVDGVETGDYTVQLDDTTGVEKGDLVLLEAVDADGVLGHGQPPGEPHSISEVEGNTVRLEDSIVWREGYSPGTLAYVIAPITVHMSGFSLASPAKDGDYLGVAARHCRDSTFEGLWLDKFGNRGIMLEACANFRVRDCTVLQSSNIEAGDGYGIQVWAGCHDIIVDGCVAKECRHPISVTPGGHREVASRTITFRDCYVTADGSAALNCHGGGAHDLRFEGCMVHTWNEPGVRTGAQETNVSGCEFRMDGHNAIDTRNDGQEMTITVTDTDVFGAGSAVHLDEERGYEFEPSWKLVQIENLRAHGCTRFFELEDGDIDRVRELAIRGCYWDEVDEEGLRIANRIDGGVIEGNDFGDTHSDLHVRARDTPTTAITNLHIVGNRFRQPQGTDAFILLSQSENCLVSENKFEAGAAVNMYVDGTDSTGNAVKENTLFAPSPPADPVELNDGSIARGNDIYDTEEGSWVR